MKGFAFLLLLFVTGCTGYDRSDGCGLLACSSSPLTEARGMTTVGMTEDRAMLFMGLPTRIVPHSTGARHLLYSRSDGRGNVCVEVLTSVDGVIQNWTSQGNCGLAAAQAKREMR